MEKRLSSLMALSLMGITSMAAAADSNCKACGSDSCSPRPPAECYADDCCRMHCLGPEQVNPSVRPKTCDGDLTITVSGIYWNAHQDGMEYAIDDNVENPGPNPAINPPTAIQELNNLINANYRTPNFKWKLGFQLGLGYNTTHDGWDINALWTWYEGRASSHVEAEADDNHVLLPLWSAFNPFQGSVLYATDIETFWKLDMNLVDLELGREFWTSKYLSLRPFAGVRIAFISQDFQLEHKGGAFSASTTSSQPAFNDEVDMENNFKGAGLRAGLNSWWNLGCGWAIYGNLAGSIVYGRFSLESDEEVRLATSPHDKMKVLETSESFRSSRAMVDLSLGIQYSTMFSDCRYGLIVALGWEQHMFFHQNQMWRVQRLGNGTSTTFPNNNGENVFYQRRGNLDTAGWTLSVKFEF